VKDWAGSSRQSWCADSPAAYNWLSAPTPGRGFGPAGRQLGVRPVVGAQIAQAYGGGFALSERRGGGALTVGRGGKAAGLSQRSFVQSEPSMAALTA